MMRFVILLFVSLLLPVAGQAKQKPAPVAAAKPVAKKPVIAPPVNPVSSGINPPETDAHYAYLIDFDTGRVLDDKNGEEHMPTSSMSKMMTMYLVFQELKDGHLHLTDKLPVSERAWRTGGGGVESSDMFAKLGDNIAVEDLIRGVIIQSGNDATVVLAEGIAGSEDAFADRMNQKAAELGMNDSHFVNASGLPDPNHYSTCKDLAILAKRLITDFPEYYHYFSEIDFTWNGIHQQNRNPLLYKGIGVDGLKTGHAEAAGYGLTASGQQGGHRLILVINGLPSMQARADEPTTLLEWGWHEFRLYDLVKPGTVVGEAPVWMGKAQTVPVAVSDDAKMTLTMAERHDLKATMVFDGPVAAPVAVGQKVGVMRIAVPGQDVRDFPLVATAPVEKLGAMARIFASLHAIVSGHA